MERDNDNKLYQQFQYFVLVGLRGWVTTEYHLCFQTFEEQCFEEITVNTEIKTN